MEIRFQSDVGRRRNMNQDYTNVFENQVGIPLAILADGMGGHLAGDVASQMVVTSLGESWNNTSFSTVEETTEWMQENIRKANKEVYETGQERMEYTGMGTTVVMATLLNDQVVIANVGDSRAYVLRSKELLQITEDHSWVNELVKSGEISKEAAETHPQKNVLVRTVGMPGEVEADIFLHSWEPGDYIILCSDGLTNMVSEAGIAEIVSDGGSLEDKVAELINQANDAGGADNITVLIIQCEEDNQ